MRLTLTKNICWAEWTGGCIKRSCCSIRTDSSIKLNGALLRSNSRGQSEERQDGLGKHCKERDGENNERVLMSKGKKPRR